MKLVSIIGARPQIIKAAAVTRAIAEFNTKHADCAISETIVHTGQHYDEKMSQVFFDELDIPKPDYNLEVGSGFHGEQTGKMLQRIEAILIKEIPDLCVVYGDTNSTLAGALAAVKFHIPVAHVEAGLRSFNRRMPEEINRVVTDHVSELLFCPTKISVDNLAKEGISAGVHQVGDVMFDCIRFYAKRANTIEQKILEGLDIRPKSYYLATVHRAENTDDGNRLAHILEALNDIATTVCPVVLPLHPRTVKYARKHSLEFAHYVKVIQPVSYLEMVALENNARLILTDSGGVQKEAYWLSVPCITLRDETEWVETVESGWNILAGADKHHIINSVRHGHRQRDVAPESVYGNGSAANQICGILQRI
ncbi:non-hydrolyzing UDP-N-acetylglucosamine 2-epimerase [Planctomycetota bacterium]